MQTRSDLIYTFYLKLQSTNVLLANFKAVLQVNVLLWAHFKLHSN